MFTLIQGAWATKALAVALDIELFTRISRGAGTVEKVSQECGIDMRLLTMLTNSLKGLGTIQGEGETIKNSPGAENFLVKGKPGYIGDFLLMVGDQYYDVWRGLKNVVLTGKPVRDDRAMRLSDPRYAEAHIKAMYGISDSHARELVEVLDLSDRKSLLEIGGGKGTYSVEIARKNPGIKAVVFDSPFSCDVAERYIKGSGLKNVTTQGGDHVKGGVPPGHDVVMLTHVLQDLPPQKCEDLLRKVYDALPKGGKVVINSFRLEQGGTEPAFSSLYALNAFMLSNGGSLYTQKEVSGWLVSVGFQGVKLLKTSSLFIVSLQGTKA